MKERICKECGKVFATESKYQICCSHECYRKRHLRQMREHREYAQRLKALKLERLDKARRRREFFAARDAAFEKAGLPPPKIEIRDGKRIETRGRCPGGRANSLLTFVDRER